MTELFNCQDWRKADRFDPSVLLTIGVGIFFAVALASLV